MEPTKKEEFRVSGEDLLKTVKKLIAEGNVRTITIKNKDGKVLMSFSVTIGVVGAVIAPVLVAVGAIAALVTECTIVVEREGPKESTSMKPSNGREDAPHQN